MMFFHAKIIALGLSAAVSTLALPTGLDKRAVIASDAVVGFPQTVPSGTAGTLYLKYKPYLKIFNGCVAFPAVDSAGNTGCVFHILHTLHPEIDSI